MNYWRRYPGDYQRDTNHLSLAEHGAYTLLLDAYYSTEKPLPPDVPSLWRICHATERHEKAAVEAVANEFFPLNGDGRRHNARADRQLAKDLEFLSGKQAAGKKSAQVRREKYGTAQPSGPGDSPNTVRDSVRNRTPNSARTAPEHQAEQPPEPPSPSPSPSPKDTGSVGRSEGRPNGAAAAKNAGRKRGAP